MHGINVQSKKNTSNRCYSRSRSRSGDRKIKGFDKSLLEYTESLNHPLYRSRVTRSRFNQWFTNSAKKPKIKVIPPEHFTGGFSRSLIDCKHYAVSTFAFDETILSGLKVRATVHGKSRILVAHDCTIFNHFFHPHWDSSMSSIMQGLAGSFVVDCLQFSFSFSC